MANPLALRDDSLSDDQDQELDVSTPLSYFDEVPPLNEEAGCTGGARPPAPAKPPRPSPHVRINMTTTIVHSMGDNDNDNDGDSDGAEGDDDRGSLGDHPPKHNLRARRKFRIEFKDVCSPEKRSLPPADAAQDDDDDKKAPISCAPNCPPSSRFGMHQHKKAAVPSPQRRVQEEGLGDDWASKPWKEPSVHVAQTRRKRALVQQGKMNLWTTGPEDLLFLGIGNALYFYFVRAIAIFCFFACVLHIPHLVIAHSGRKLEPYKITRVSASSFMAASHMVQWPGANTTRWCDGDTINTMFARKVPCTEPIIRLYSPRSSIYIIYIKATHASYLISACDLLSCLLFVATWLWLVWKHDQLKKAKSLDVVVSAEDYAVHVRGLPPDATEAEIVEHFNGLYAINGGQDWTWPGNVWGLFNAKPYQRGPDSIVDIAGRVIGPSLAPVDAPLPAHAHQPSIYKGSWVVEAVVAHPMGTLIRRFRSLEKLSQKLLWQRAVAKKVNANTTYMGGKGANKAKFLLAKKELEATQCQIAAEQIKLKAMAGALVKMERHCVGAYVIFEHRRSRDRALRDYRLYSNHGLFCVQPPTPLLFRGKHRLVVTEAPPPSDVRWEALEANVATRGARRLLTNGVTLCLLVLALLITVTLSQISDTYAQGAGRDLDACEGLGSTVYEAPDAQSWFHLLPGNAFCPAKKHYVSMLPPGSNSPNPCAEPCLDVEDQATLGTAWPCTGGTELSQAALLKCYCYSTWDRLSSVSYPSSSSASSVGLKDLSLSYDALQVCNYPAYEYIISQVVSVVASGITTLTNEIISLAVPILVEWELHASLTQSVTTLFTKSLASMFLNTCGLLLLLHLRIRHHALNKIGFFTGSAVDFDLQWYLAIGVALSNTMLINSIAMHLPSLVTELLVKPVRRWLQVTKVSQMYMNKCFQPSPFQIHTRLAMLVNTLAITLLFSTALPALMVFCFVAFALAFVVDKYLLLRCYERPPAYDGRLVRLSIDMMPYLLALHLFVGVLVLGNTDVFPSALWHRRSLAEIGHTKASEDILTRFSLSSTLPLTVLLALLVLGKAVVFVGMDVFAIGQFVGAIVGPYTRVCCKGRLAAEMEVAVDEGASKKTTSRHSRRRVNNHSPYTRRFEVVYPDRAAVPNFVPGSGWVVVGEGETGPMPRSRCVTLCKQWTQEELGTSVAPAASHEGEEEGGAVFKNTWEVIRENGLATFRIEDNAEYEEVLLVRATLHLSAKSLLGIESPSLDLSRLFTMREFKAHAELEEDEEDEEEEEDKEAGAEKDEDGGRAKAAAFWQRVQQQKTTGNKKKRGAGEGEGKAATGS